ncbi:MAG: RNA-binding S4 domain-containing protein [Chitinophagales bacterium]
MPNKTRIDKWLWSVRIYKSRSVATEACKSGRVKVDAKSVKPSYTIEEGQTVTVNKKEKKWVVKCLNAIEKRVSAEIAQTCYEDFSPPEQPSNKLGAFFYTTSEMRDKGVGRPTKRERRVLDKFKDIDEEE